MHWISINIITIWSGDFKNWWPTTTAVGSISTTGIFYLYIYIFIYIFIYILLCQLYILACCQESDETIYKFKGGLRDKPNTQPGDSFHLSLFLFSKISDFYHTCYALSGLSLSQRNTNDVPSTVVGPSEQNLVNPTDSLYNVDTRALQSAREYFSNHPFKTADGKIGTEGAGVTHLLNKTKPIWLVNN